LLHNPPANVALEYEPGQLEGEWLDEMCARQIRGESTDLLPGTSKGQRCSAGSSGATGRRRRRLGQGGCAVPGRGFAHAQFRHLPSSAADNDVDSSLSGVLNYAHGQGIQFGPTWCSRMGRWFPDVLLFSPHAAACAWRGCGALPGDSHRIVPRAWRLRRYGGGRCVLFFGWRPMCRLGPTW